MSSSGSIGSARSQTRRSASPIKRKKQLMTPANSRHYPAALLFHDERRARIILGSPKSQGLTPTVQVPSPARQPALSSAVTETRGLHAGWMPNALAQLSQIDKEAAEEGYPPISDTAKRSVERLLFALGDSPIEPAVYPSKDGEIAIYFKSPVVMAALLILVNNRGGAGCYASTHGENRRWRCDDSSVLPDEFLKEQLRALGGASLWQQSLA